MLLLDLDFFKLQEHRVFMVNMITTVALLIAKGWKTCEMPTLEEWMSDILVLLVNYLLYVGIKQGRRGILEHLWCIGLLLELSVFMFPTSKHECLLTIL